MTECDDTVRAYEHVYDCLLSYFHNGRDPGELSKALVCCWQNNLQIPEDLIGLIVALLEDKRSERPGRGQHSPQEQDAAFERDVIRGITVRRLKQQKVPEREVYQAAADELQGTEHEGSDTAIRDSWRRVKGVYIPTLG